jgi:hypothetical protein
MYKIVSRHQNLGQNHSLLNANKSFENVANLNIWEQQKQIKIQFTKKLKAD